jgi:hypothetical protein
MLIHTERTTAQGTAADRLAHVTVAAAYRCAVCAECTSGLRSELTEFFHGYHLSRPNLFTVTVYPDRIGSRLSSVLTELVHGYRLP